MNTHNKLIAIILATALFNTASATLAEVRTVDYLQYREGIAYEVNSEKPFTGKLLLEIPGWLVPLDKEKSEINYKDGKLHGLKTVGSGSGKKFEGMYKNGEKHGLVTEWYSRNKRKSEGSWKNGKPNGFHTKWYAGGKWHVDGQRKSERSWKNGRRDGPATYLYENGQIKSKGYWKDDKLHGVVTEWGKSGQKTAVGNYKHGKRHGLATWRDKSGKQIKACYKSGNEVNMGGCSK